MKQRRSILIPLFVNWLLIGCPVSFAVVIEVPEDYPTLSEAIAASNDGDTIIAANGSYSGPMNTNLDFEGKQITVRSESGFADCVIDCGEAGRAFMFHSQETPQSIIQGFTISNGHSSGGYPDGSGGAVSCMDASPTIRSCRFIDCKLQGSPVYGGAIFCNSNSSASIIECSFENGEASHGAAIAFLESDGYVAECDFFNNHASENGGAIYVFNGSPLIEACRFQENECYSQGGAIHLSGSASNIFSCRFECNAVILEGGAIYCHYNATPVIGGSASHANVFYLNRAGIGSDMFGDPSYPVIDASYNDFSDCYLYDYSIFRSDRFDTSNCVSHIERLTQDAYISPNGNDQADGLSWNTAFRTIRRALRAAYPSETNPITIHLSEGLFSVASTGEFFPLPMMQYVKFVGTGQESTTIDAEGTAPIFIAYRESEISIENMTLMGFAGPGGLYSERSFPVIRNCRWTGNPESQAFTGIYFSGSMPEIDRCIFQNHDMAIYSVLSVTKITNSLFENNKIGLHLMNSLDSEVTNVEFINNTDFGITAFDSSIVLNKSDFRMTRASSFGAAVCLSNIFEPLPIINDCSFEGFTGSALIGNIARILICNCRFQNNSGEYGGAIQFNSLNYPLDLFNCRFVSNQAQYGGAVYSHRSQVHSRNCTFMGNQAQTGGAYYCAHTGHPYFFDTIMWDNHAEYGSAIALGNDPYPSCLEIYYSDIQDGPSSIFMTEGNQLVWGDGNMDLPPLFTEGPLGSLYLSQIQSGQTVQSPCVNAGSDASIDICDYVLPGMSMCMDDLTTRTDGGSDDGTVDIGYHYPFNIPHPIPTPYPTILPTHSPTPIPPTQPPPTETPTPAHSTGVDLILSSSLFCGGDVFYLKSYLTNSSEAELENVPFVVVLEIASEYYFYPEWKMSFDFIEIDVPSGTISLDILQFIWPAIENPYYGCRLYGAFLNQELNQIFGTWDFVEFGWC